MSYDIESWERALKGVDEIYSGDWEAIIREALVDADPEDIESAIDDPTYEFDQVVEPYQLGCLNMEFPHSTHGDGASATVYRLPGGTTVIRGFATFEMDKPDAVFYRGRDFSEMSQLAWDLIDSGADYGEMQDLDEDPDYDPDADTVTDGSAELEKAWKTALRRERRRRG